MTGQVVLTPIQRWFFQISTVCPDHFTQSLCVELTDEIDEQALQAALNSIPSRRTSTGRN